MIKTGDLDRAVQLYNGILRRQEGQNGKESREYNETLGLLGLVLAMKQENSEALACLSIVLQWQEEKLGTTHAATQFTNGLVKRISRKASGSNGPWI